jgi:hypothetical protein
MKKYGNLIRWQEVNDHHRMLVEGKKMGLAGEAEHTCGGIAQRDGEG